MGLIHWIVWYLRQTLKPTRTSGENGVFSKQESAISWHPNTNFKEEPNGSENTHNDASEAQLPHKCKQSTSPRVILPRQVSSNLIPPAVIPVRSKSQRQSFLGRFIYFSLSSFIDEQKLVVSADGADNSSSSPPPLWKVLASLFKLIGLGGFWAGDNIAYLYASGFLTDASPPSTQRTMTSSKTLPTKSGRGKDAAIFAARSYFFAAVSGLYLNSREFLRYRNGPLRKAMDDVTKFKMQDRKVRAGGRQKEDVCTTTNLAYDEHEHQRELDRLEDELEMAKRKHASICIALLKSCCDTIVFSNNQGIDLHLKYGGKKMNEGLHCACGIASALTVLYNNFPSSLTKK
mmetsp:Transcript_22674/g.33199  ORF Transcript_22674/g.33199 Transcript_22674/m.33199 type:complete len:346 (-) Transcript_22674:31-1068(-)